MAFGVMASGEDESVDGMSAYVSFEDSIIFSHRFDFIGFDCTRFGCIEKMRRKKGQEVVEMTV